MNYRTGLERYGPIKKQQLWRKIDTGRVMRIAAKNSNNCWSVTFEGTNNNRAHHIKERDIFKFYEKVE